MYIHGLFASDEVMENYVQFICSHILNLPYFSISNCGASVHKTDGFPMKGYYVPVRLAIIVKKRSSIDISIMALGHIKETTFFMSRHKSPDALLHELQEKIDEVVSLIISENKLDRDKIWNEHHPLKNLKLPKFDA